MSLTGKSSRIVVLTSVLLGAVVVLPQTTPQALAMPAINIQSVATPPSGLVQQVAVFGKDDRRPVPRKYRPLELKIGHVTNAKTHTQCSAFCLAPNIMGTAAHCLFQPTKLGQPNLNDFVFAIHKPKRRPLYSRVSGYGRGIASHNVITGTTRLRVRPPIDASRDWALVKLSRPICRAGGFPVHSLKMDEAVTESKRDRVFQLAYHRDFTFLEQAYSQPCRVRRSFGKLTWQAIAKDFIGADALLLHDCDTGGASSGSPMLFDGPRGPSVFAINVGTYLQSRVYVRNGRRVKPTKSRKIANTAVSASVFAPMLEALKTERTLTERDDIQDLQSRLKEAGHYIGPLDGRFGDLTRLAIRAWQRSNGELTTGLPTVELLEKLGSGPPLPVQRGTVPVKAAALQGN